MTPKELAERLNGREYGSEITLEEMHIAKEFGLVVVFGASDDLMEFRGAIDDEGGCFGGGTVYFDQNGVAQDDEVIKSFEIESIWGMKAIRGFMRRISLTKPLIFWRVIGDTAEVLCLVWRI